MSDKFPISTHNVSAPARDAFAITPHASDELDVFTTRVYVGTGGDLVVRLVDAVEDVTFESVPSGSLLPIRVRAVRAAGTTATGIVGLF